MILSEHLVRCDTDGIDYNTHWYKWTIGRLQQVFLFHQEQVQKYSSTLETLLFTRTLILIFWTSFINLFLYEHKITYKYYVYIKVHLNQ